MGERWPCEEWVMPYNYGFAIVVIAMLLLILLIVNGNLSL